MSGSEEDIATEDQAKKQLRKMLRSFAPGSINHLPADSNRQCAEEARQENCVESYRRFGRVEEALFVVGLGIDAACPQ